MRKVFLDDLPRRIGQKNAGQINWNKSVGYSVEFIYDDIEGTIKILEFNKNYLSVEYNNNVGRVLSSNFSKCKIGVIVGKINKKHLYKSNQIVKTLSSGKIKIIRPLHLNGSDRRGYEYECLTCGNTDIIDEYNLTHGSGCNSCSNAPKKVTVGFNDIWTKNPNLGNLLWNQSDGYKFTSSSGQRVDFKCPNCGERIKNKQISSVSYFGLSCPRCSDGRSYPEKLVYNVLKQAGVFDLESQYSPDWAVVTGHKNKKINGKKYYDFNSKSYNFSLEVHGGYHNRETSRKGKRAKSLIEEQENDRLKEELHSKNDVAKYIKIIADKSELEYIKQNLLNSELTRIINLDIIDWNKCEIDSRKSWVRIACDYFNEGNYSTTDISKLMGLSVGTIGRYLKQGANIGWCNYDAKEAKKKSNKKAGKNHMKKIIQLSLSGVFINEYQSATIASENLNICIGNISSVCNGKRKSTGGFRWMYKEDYEKIN